MQRFLIDNNNKKLSGNVVANLYFGLLVTIDGVTGLIPKKCFIQSKQNFTEIPIGTKMNFYIDGIENDKLVFKL